MATQYTWERIDVDARLFCKSHTCQRLHYKYKQPRQPLHYLVCKPARTSYVNEILFCPRCKELKIPGWG